MLFCTDRIMDIDLESNWIAVAKALAFATFIHADLLVYRGRAAITQSLVLRDDHVRV